MAGFFCIRDMALYICFTFQLSNDVFVSCNMIKV